jgi:hypothetical protein
MEYREEKFVLNVKDNQFNFQGKIEKTDYSALGKFLVEAEKQINTDELCFDFRPLEYLNSSGVRAIAVFFLGTQKKVCIHINEGLTWQRIGLTPLGNMKSEGIQVIGHAVA